jgi:opacity protein-like surface antigen
MKRKLFLIALAILPSLVTQASPFLGVSPSLVKPQVDGQSSDMGFGINVRGGYEFLSSRYFLTGHAIELETGIAGFSFNSGTVTGDISARMIPVFANYRLTQYFGSSASNSNGMEYWSPDFILYAGAGLGGVHVSANENSSGPISIDISQVNMAAQLFFGLGIGFNEHLSLTTGYRHIFMNDIDAEGVDLRGATVTAFNRSYNASFHVFDLNLRLIW